MCEGREEEYRGSCGRKKLAMREPRPRRWGGCERCEGEIGHELRGAGEGLGLELGYELHVGKRVDEEQQQKDCYTT